jgi:hypothetical protein
VLTELPTSLTEEIAMAKGQQKSNREKKKPKQEKAKRVTAVSQFSIQQPRTTTGPTTAKNK